MEKMNRTVVAIGDRVTLKSGGELMTVAEVREGNAKCFWWNTSQGIGSGGPADFWFPVAILEVKAN
jgi:uncharacterized protein YodC (DUF2158 family)